MARAGRGLGDGGLVEALDFPSGSFQEDATDGQARPRKELLGAEWAEA